MGSGDGVHAGSRDVVAVLIDVSVSHTRLVESAIFFLKVTVVTQFRVVRTA